MNVKEKQKKKHGMPKQRQKCIGSFLVEIYSLQLLAQSELTGVQKTKCGAVEGIVATGTDSNDYLKYIARKALV